MFCILSKEKIINYKEEQFFLKNLFTTNFIQFIYFPSTSTNVYIVFFSFLFPVLCRFFLYKSNNERKKYFIFIKQFEVVMAVNRKKLFYFFSIYFVGFFKSLRNSRFLFHFILIMLLCFFSFYIAVRIVKVNSNNYR